MNTKNQTSLTRKAIYGAILLAVLFLFTLSAGSFPSVRAQEIATNTPRSIITDIPTYQVSAAQAQAILTGTQTLPSTRDCIPGTGWTWTTGPLQPELANQAELALSNEKIEATVTASSFGEMDSCGNFELFSTDFSITLTTNSSLSLNTQSDFADNIISILSQVGVPRLGNVQINYGSGDTKVYTNTMSAQNLMATTEPSVSINSLTNRKVYLLVYNPVLSNGQDLSTYMGWTPYSTLVQGIIDSFSTASHGQLRYAVAYTKVVTDEWPVKIDGFRYIESTYLPAYQNHTAHAPDDVNYDAIIDDSRFDICGKLNRGEIDELWMYGGPYFGFYESRLVGPGAYWYNSLPMYETHNCNKLLPIMGLNYERGVAEAMHSFGHRAESTMTKVYGSWQENRTAHNWDRFALVKALSPNYTYSGCGNIHYPPNGVSDYDYGNTSTTSTNCGDFYNYPNLSNPQTIMQPVTCTTWNCDHLAYMLYWFGHLPSSNIGCGTDAVANNWWLYFADANLALTPSLPCPPLWWEQIIPKAPILRSPRTNTITKDTTPTFWWANVTGGQTYEIVFATNSTFTSNVSTHTGNGPPYTVTSPLGNGKYYWHVRANNAHNEPGAWSSARIITIDTAGPLVPVLSSPAHNASSSRTPAFKWLSVPTAVSYEFQYDDSSNLLSPLYTVTVRGTFRRPPAMSPGVYYWRVRAKDAVGNWSNWSTPFKITIGP